MVRLARFICMHDVIVVLEDGASVSIVAVILVLGPISFFWARSGSDRSSGPSLDDPVWSGRYAEAILVRAKVSPRMALESAFTAVQEVGSRAGDLWDSRTVVGWYNNFNFFPCWQLAIVLRGDPDGSIQFLCCCRPRFVRWLFDYGVSRQRARKLASMVTELTGPSQLPPAVPIVPGFGN
jgi:hypothetical protein